MEQIFVCILLVAVFMAFVKEWFPPDLVAMGAFVLLMISGVLPADKALLVFANPDYHCVYVYPECGTGENRHD